MLVFVNYRQSKTHDYFPTRDALWVGSSFKAMTSHLLPQQDVIANNKQRPRTCSNKKLKKEKLDKWTV